MQERSSSRRSSISSSSTTCSTGKLSIRSMSTDNLITVEDKFLKKSSKKSPVGFQGTPRLDLLDSKNFEQYHKTGTGIYYFPNGEVFRPRSSRSKRSKPFKLQTQTRSNDQMNNHLARSKSNESNSRASSMTSTSSASPLLPGVPRSASFRSLTNRNKHNLAKNLRSSKLDINTNIALTSGSSASLSDNGTQKLQSTNLLLKNGSLGSLTDDVLKSSDSTTSSLFNYKLNNSSSNTPSTSINTSEESHEVYLDLKSDHSTETEDFNLSTLNEISEDNIASKAKSDDYNTKDNLSSSYETSSNITVSQNDSNDDGESLDYFSEAVDHNLLESECEHEGKASELEIGSQNLTHEIADKKIYDGSVSHNEGDSRKAADVKGYPEDILKENKDVDDEAVQNKQKGLEGLNRLDKDLDVISDNHELENNIAPDAESKSEVMDTISIIEDKIESEEIREKERIGEEVDEEAQNQISDEDSDETMKNEIPISIGLIEEESCSPSNGKLQNTGSDGESFNNSSEDRDTMTESQEYDYRAKNANARTSLTTLSSVEAKRDIQVTDSGDIEDSKSSHLEQKPEESTNDHEEIKLEDMKSESSDSSSKSETFYETEQDVTKFINDTQTEVPPRGDIEVIDKSKIKRHHRASSSISSFNSISKVQENEFKMASPKESISAERVEKDDSPKEIIQSSALDRSDQTAFFSNNSTPTSPTASEIHAAQDSSSNEYETHNRSLQKPVSSMLLSMELVGETSKSPKGPSPPQVPSKKTTKVAKSSPIEQPTKRSSVYFSSDKKKSPSIANFKLLWSKLTGKKEVSEARAQKTERISFQSKQSRTRDTANKFKKSFLLSNLKVGRDPKENEYQLGKVGSSQRLLEDETFQISNSFQIAEPLTLPKLSVLDSESNMLDEVLHEFDERLEQDDASPVDIGLHSKLNEPFLKDDELTRDQIEDQQIKDMPIEVDRSDNSSTEESYVDDNIRFIQEEFFWPEFEDQSSNTEIKDNSKEIPVPLQESDFNDETIVLNSQQLNSVFNDLPEYQKRSLPAHLKYVEQFKGCNFIEVNVKKFEDLASIEFISTPRSATSSILKKVNSASGNKKVLFSNKISINETFPAEMYKRYNKCVTHYTLTEASEVNKIKTELNSYKCNEMLVHEDSQDNTQFFY
ncbi:uncharacterized protein PRCAT00003405001 [Priceomyces carsonii]|uniref:uncharacterized protein n=1 Tax=Priceomyces carsonii TaxID=28549 RepID=UPI002ED77768|nr:unnamed protein product [Priceomyces carsonii]